MVIMPEELYSRVFDELAVRFDYPSASGSFKCEVTFRSYRFLNDDRTWNDSQEKLVNDIFKRMGDKDIYALDWNHDCFIFSPYENIPVGTCWHDDERDCNVYFPTYYPDGDYFAFTATDFSYGLFGHPWKHEIYVVGEKLVEMFEMYKGELEIEPI